MLHNILHSKPRNLGAEGPAGGPLALGTWRLTSHDMRQNTLLIGMALDAEMNLIDSADVYGRDHGGTAFDECETKPCKVFKANASLRNRMALASKVAIHPSLPYDFNAAHLQHAVDSSPARLGVECMDL